MARTHAVCKDCRAKGEDAKADFEYSPAWQRRMEDRGNDVSDRCPVCRRSNRRALFSMAMPYPEVDVLGPVADPDHPTGPLGGLGPLPVDHSTTEEDVPIPSVALGDEQVLELLAGLEKKQVAVLTAPTGAGKSTFVPFRLMMPPQGATLDLCRRGPIVITQPRKDAAIRPAKTVAETYLHSQCGAGYDVGYRVKGDNNYDWNCRLIYVTDGSLINWIRDGDLSRFGAIVIDEAHERSWQIDLLLGYLRNELPRFPELRVIICSATIDARFFIHFFGGEDRVVPALFDQAPEHGYGEPLWPMDSELDFGPISWPQPDRAAEARRMATLRVSPDVEIPMGDFASGWRSKMPSAVVAQVLAIAEAESDGDILAFLPTKDMIDDAVAKLAERLQHKPVRVHRFLGSLSKDEREASLDKSPGRKIIVASPAAETSLTLDRLRFVVDSGLITQPAWDPVTATQSMPTLAHSQAGVRQRWGRVGRVAPGFVFPLYSKRQYLHEMPAQTVPSVCRASLEDFVLAARAAGVDSLLEYPWPASGGGVEERDLFLAELKRAEAHLRTQGVLDESTGDITDLGMSLVAFSGSVSAAIAMEYAEHLGCPVEMATALAVLLDRKASLVGDVFEDSARNSAATTARLYLRHEVLRAGCIDDLDVAVKTFSWWDLTGRDEQWSKAFGLRQDALVEIREQRATYLKSVMLAVKNPVIPAPRMQMMPRVRAILSAVMTEPVFGAQPDGWVNESDRHQLFKLDPASIRPDGEKLLALRREYRHGAAELSNLIERDEEAVGKSWSELAALFSDRRAAGVGIGATLADHLSGLGWWVPGDVWKCRFGSGRLSPVAPVLSHAYTGRRRQMRDLADIDAEEGLDSDEGVDPEDQTPDRTLNGAAPLSMERREFEAAGLRAALADGDEVLVQLMGATGVGSERQLVVEELGAGVDPEVYMSYSAGDPLHADVVACSDVYSTPFGLLRDRKSAHLIGVGGEDISLGRDRRAVLALGLGTELELTVKVAVSPKQELEVTRTPHLLALFRSSLASPTIAKTEWLPAVCGEAQRGGGFIDMAVDFGDPLGTRWVLGYPVWRLERAIPAVAGVRAVVRLQPTKATSREVRDPPRELQEVLQSAGGAISLAERGSRLSWSAPISELDRDRLLNIGSPLFQTSVWACWRESNAFQIVDAEAADPASDPMLKYSPGTATSGVVDGFTKDGAARVLLEPGVIGILFADQTEYGNGTDLREKMSIGQSVGVRTASLGVADRSLRLTTLPVAVRLPSRAPQARPATVPAHRSSHPRTPSAPVQPAARSRSPQPQSRANFRLGPALAGLVTIAVVIGLVIALIHGLSSASPDHSADGTTPTSPAFQPVTRTINARPGLRLRQQPSSGSPTVRQTKTGDQVQVVCQVTGESVEGNSIWFRTDEGLYGWSGGIDGPSNLPSLLTVCP